jgi:hypothetical protein
MLSHRSAVCVLALFVLLWSTGGLVVRAAPPAPPTGDEVPNNAVGTAITYQGQLTQGGSGVTAICDMAFRLFDTVVGGQQIGNPISSTVPVTGALFTVALDFGASAFTGDARYLEIRVRCPVGSGSFTTLSPRTTLAAAPYALTLRSGALISGTADSTLRIINNNTDSGLGLEVNSIGDGITVDARGQYGTGLQAYADEPNGKGVFASGGSIGVSGNSETGTGVHARADDGTALYVEGQSRQSRTGGGLVKALVSVYLNDIDQCFNGQVIPPRTDAAGDCGFDLAVSGATFTVTLGFNVADRFFSVTPFYESPTAVHATVGAVGANYVVVRTWSAAGAPLNSAFFLQVY